MGWSKSGNIRGPAGANGTGSTRTTTTVTTGSVANNVSITVDIVLSKTYLLMAIQTSKPARVTAYESAAARTADANRAVGTDPTSTAGVVLDYVTSDATAQGLSPLVTGRNNENPVTTTIPLRVTNMGSSGTIDVTLTWLKVE